MVISQQRSPGVEFCTGVASALRLPPEMVFRKAGLLPERADPAPAAAEILYLFNQLDEAAQEEALMIMRGYLREKLRRADTIPSATNA